MWELKEHRGLGKGSGVIPGQDFVGIPELRGGFLATPDAEIKDLGVNWGLGVNWDLGMK